jgi:hypothetical protein
MSVEDATLVDLREKGGHLILLFRWKRDPQLYGFRLDSVLKRWEKGEGSDEAWPREHMNELAVAASDAFFSGRRVRKGSYVALAEHQAWPWDERYFEKVDTLATVQHSLGGIDDLVVGSTSIPMPRAPTPNQPGQSDVCAAAAVSLSSPKVAQLDYLAAREDAPPSVIADVARIATYTAAGYGAQTIQTRSDLPVLRLLGFSGMSHGERVAATNLIDEDQLEAMALRVEVTD